MKDIGYHKNIVNLVGCSTVQQPMCLIVEFMAGGDMVHFLTELGTKHAVTALVLSTDLNAWQIASGMVYLTGNNLIHRELSGRNILIAQDRTVKISDFGLTRAVSNDLIYMSTKYMKLPIKWIVCRSHI